MILLGRITEVKLDNIVTESYTYDENGNRLTASIDGENKTATYDNEDRILTYGDNSYREK